MTQIGNTSGSSRSIADNNSGSGLAPGSSSESGSKPGLESNRQAGLSDQGIDWQLDLIRRYDQAGPRYTSYPTAPYFEQGFGFNDYLQFLEAQKDSNAPVSLYFHIPFCAHVCYYCACNKVVTKKREMAIPYLEALKQEIEFYSEKVGNRPVEQLHFGGGTPTFIDNEQMKDLMDWIGEKFNLLESDKRDYSIEIDPREVDYDKLKNLKELGFNRVSLGVQDLNPVVQKAVNRVQPIELTQQIYQWAQELGFRSINMDLIYGLPLQTSDSFSDTLDKIIELRPARLSVFNYAHLPHRFMPQRRINEEDLPNPEQKLKMFEASIKKLVAAGYQYIGMDHFALPDDSLAVAQRQGELHRNFQGYTTHGECDLVAMGVSAISQVGPYYVQNTADNKLYLERIGAENNALNRGLKMNQDDHIRGCVIKHLICNFELDIHAVERIFGIQFRQYFDSSLTKLTAMAEDGLVEINADWIKVLPAGRLLIRNICMAFDGYIDDGQTKGKTIKYSKVI